MSLTFINQVGAVNGVNQSAPGSFIPETFVRWAQDVLFDRAGHLRRRAPFSLFPLYANDASGAITYPNVAGEQTVNTVSTLSPSGEKVSALIVSDDNSSRILFYNEDFKNTGESSISFIGTSPVYDCKQASNGGMWLSFLESYKPSDASNEYYQYYWYGGRGTDHTITETTLDYYLSAHNSKHSTYKNTIQAKQYASTAGNTATRFIFDANSNNAINATSYVTFPASITHGIVVGDIIKIQISAVESAENIAQHSGTFVVVHVSGSNVYYNNLGGAGGVPDTLYATITKIFDTTKLTPGMFLYASYGSPAQDYYIGTIKTVTESLITLEKNIIRFTYDTNIHTTTAARINVTIKAHNVRPYIHSHGRGLITRQENQTTVTSGLIGTEGEGHFKSADLDGSVSGIKWAIYRNSDYAWIGDVETVTDNQSLSLDADHHARNDTPAGDSKAMQADEYIAYPYAPVPSSTITTSQPTKVAGVFNATYAGYQWFGNAGGSDSRNRVVFSAYHNAEAVDLSKDAPDSIVIPGTSEMRGMATSSSGLVVFMADKTYIIRGNYRANFSLEELYPEGCLSSMSIVEYGGGVFWASKVGILFYDGASVRNLTENNLGVYYTDSIKNYSVQNDRVYSFLHKDYLFVHFTSFDSAFKPVRYEPIYAEGISTTPAIQDFEANDWDPNFKVEDFDPANNVPIYWDYIKMYESIATTGEVVVPVWNNGYSFSKAAMTAGSNSVTQLSYTSATYGTINTDDISVGDIVIGHNVPGPYKTGADYRADYTVVTTKNSSTITMSNNAIATTIDNSANANYNDEVEMAKRTIQIIPTAPSATWAAGSSKFIWGPAATNEGITMAIYLPTNAFSALSNFDFTGAFKIDAPSGLKAVMGTSVKKNGSVFPRLIDVDSILRTDNDYDVSMDEELVYNPSKQAVLNVKGPDFFFQTKDYTAGDPVLRKWFRQVFVNLYLLDGGVRMDIVDNEDSDRFNVQKKRHFNWETWGETLFKWKDVENIIFPKILSPEKSTWGNIQNLGLSWYDISDSEFERRKKKISWRFPSVAFRLYQMNNYRPRNYQASQRPHTIITDSWSIGFKLLRKSRI